MATLVNGVSYNYANIQISFLGTQPKGISSISYAQSSENAHFYGLGYEPVALGYGNSTYEASFEMQIEEAQALHNAAAAAGVNNGDITKLSPFDITIQFGAPGQPITTHVLQKCVFMDAGVDATSGDTTLVRQYSILPASIKFA